MSHAYTDKYGYPISSVEALRRLNARRPYSVYVDGKWVPVTPLRRRADERMSASIIASAKKESPTT